MAWCFSTRASVATVLSTHPSVSSCLWVDKPQLVINYIKNQHLSSEPIIYTHKPQSLNSTCTQCCLIFLEEKIHQNAALTSLRSRWNFTLDSWVFIKSFCARDNFSSSSLILLFKSCSLARELVSSLFCFSIVSWSSITRFTSESGSIEPLDNRWNRRKK